jgi:hypothetical protein
MLAHISMPNRVQLATISSSGSPLGFQTGNLLVYFQTGNLVNGPPAPGNEGVKRNFPNMSSLPFQEREEYEMF